MQCQNAEYGKTEAELPERVEDFVRHSYVMYADKNRAIPVLRSMGLHRPMARLQYGCLNNLSYRKDHVNLWGVPLDGVIEFKDDADTYGRHKYSAGETDNDYKDAVLGLVSFMKEHDLYVPDDLQSARGAAAITKREDMLLHVLSFGASSGIRTPGEAGR